MAQRKKSRQRFEPYQMTDVDQKGFVDFTSTGRTGRRNALADILEPNHGKTSTSSLPTDMEKLKCTDDDEDEEASKSDTASALPKDDDTEEEKKKEEDSKDRSKDAKKTTSPSDDKDKSKEEEGS